MFTWMSALIWGCRQHAGSRRTRKQDATSPANECGYVVEDARCFLIDTNGPQILRHYRGITDQAVKGGAPTYEMQM